jgi:hypothetical protein
MIKRVVPLCLVAALVTCSVAVATDHVISGKISVIKPLKLGKFTSKSSAGFTLPATGGAEDPTLNGAEILMFDSDSPGAGSFTHILPAAGWSALGNPPGSKGFKYKGSLIGDSVCKVAMIKKGVIKGVCKGAIPIYPPIDGNAAFIIGVPNGTVSAAIRYCAEFGGTEKKNDTKIFKHKNAAAPGSCPVLPPPLPETYLDPQTGLMWELKTGAVGTLINCAVTACPNPHNVNNAYQWCVGKFPDCKNAGNPPDGGVFTEFLPALNAGGGFAGYTDWRIPTLAELQTIIDLAAPGCGLGDACVEQGFAPTSTTPSFYWSSDTGGDPATADGVSFSNGASGGGTKSNRAYVRGVRGP